MLNLLLAYGADPTHPDSRGVSPLAYARSLGLTRACELFEKTIQEEGRLELRCDAGPGTFQFVVSGPFCESVLRTDQDRGD